MNYTLKNVTNDVDAWFNKDPVRPELTYEFRTQGGRNVFGLLDANGEYKAFMCVSYTLDIPTSVANMDYLTDIGGDIAVPYTVWSYQKGAGKEIINQFLSLIKEQGHVKRVITLSPLTKMARNFHIKNNAVELRINETTVNFEYSTLPLI